MNEKKKPWVIPRLKRLEPTPELLELFKDKLKERGRRAEGRLRRTG